MKYAIYDIATGEIISAQEKPLVAEGQGSLSLEIFPYDYIFLHYVLDGELELRPVSSISFSEGVVSFTNTHPDAVAMVENAEGESMEFPPADMRITDAGRYYVKITQPFPYSCICTDIEHA